VNDRLQTHAALIIAALLIVGCGENDASVGPPARVALVLHGGSITGWVSYTVYASSGVAVISGGESVSDPNASLFVQLRIPPGKGDVVQMSATTSAGEPCSGTSAPFDVVAGESANVEVTLICTPTTTGADHCPTVVFWSASAASTGPPGTFDLSAVARDLDATDVLSFSWTAASGAFGSPTASVTSYACGAVPASTVTLTVSDDHLPASCNTTVILPVSCPAAPTPAP
jgi:hypothetical protein